MARRAWTSSARRLAGTPLQSGPRCRWRADSDSASGRRGARSAPGQSSNAPRIEHMWDSLVPAIAGGGAPCAETKNPRRARVSGRHRLDLLLVACPVARPRIARTIIRTAIIAVEGVAGGGTEAGHGWKLADGPDSRQDPCATPHHDGKNGRANVCTP